MSDITHESSHWNGRTNGFGRVVPAWQFIFHPVESIYSRYLLWKYCKSYRVRNALFDALAEQNRMLDFDCAKTAIAIDRIIRAVPEVSINTVCVIGDGHGIFASIWKCLSSDSTVYVINLEKILPFDKIQCEKISGGFGFRYFAAQDAYHLAGREIDLFVSIASMQEMTYDAIQYYFDIMRRSTGNRYFYCLNREVKTLPCGERVCIYDYPWMPDDFLELCNIPEWYKRYPTELPPFIEPFDGVVKEWLVKLK